MSSTTSNTPVSGAISATAAPTAVPIVSSAFTIGLSPTKVCKDGASVAEIVAVLTSVRFTVDAA